MKNQDRISIRNFEKIEKPTRTGGATLLAKFDVGIGGIDLLGCAFIEMADGHQAVLPPGAKREDGRRTVFISCLDLRARLLRCVQMKMMPTAPDDEPEDAGLRRVLGEGEGEAESLAIAGL